MQNNEFKVRTKFQKGVTRCPQFFNNFWLPDPPEVDINISIPEGWDAELNLCWVWGHGDHEGHYNMRF